MDTATADKCELIPLVDSPRWGCACGSCLRARWPKTGGAATSASGACVTDMAATETMLDGLGEMAQARADAETRAAAAERRVQELEELVTRGREVIEGLLPPGDASVGLEEFPEVDLCTAHAVRCAMKNAVNSAGAAKEAKPDAAELLEEHRRSLAVFERLKKWLDDTGLRTNADLVDASIKATRALIAKAEGVE